MIIFGVDPGTVVTGFGVIRDHRGSYEALEYGCIKPPPQEKLSTRYHIIYRSLLELIRRYEPEVLVVETQYVKHNVQSAIKLGMARGMALLAAKELGVAVFEYAPSEAKLAVVGTGAASKGQVQGMVKRLLRLSELPTPEDASDALALAICHAQRKGRGEEI